MRRTIMIVIAALIGATLTAPVSPAAAAAQLVLDGRGYGHGIGMSQYGAQGRAVAGHSYAQILAAYYPGTTLTSGADSRAVRVLVESDSDRVTTVRSEAGLSIGTSAGTAPLPAVVAGGTPLQWRIWQSAGSFILEALVNGSWRPHGDSAVAVLLNGAAYADVIAADSTVQLLLGSSYREYRGAVRAVLDGTTIRSVVVTTYAEYLPSVVASEMPSSWHAQALAAQAVAARSYAMHDQASKPAGALYDTCDTVRCQVYNGIADYRGDGSQIRSWTTPATRAAVSTTSGRYLSHSGGPAFTQFSASNGGYSVAGSRPYLQAAADPFDGYPAWRTTIDGGALQSRYPEIGVFTGVSTTRDGRGVYGGRVLTISIEGTDGTATVTGTAFRTAFGLRSTLFDPTVPRPDGSRLDLTGDGRTDLLAVHTSGSLHLWPGRGDGSFSSGAQVGHGWSNMHPLTLAYGMPGTTPNSLIAVDRATGRLLGYPIAGGSVGRPVQIGSRGWTSMNALVGVVGFDGAGSAGVVARQASTARLYYYAATSSGALANGVQIGRAWSNIALLTPAGDWNGDGHPDLIGSTTGGQLWLYMGNGDGAFLGSRQIGTGWSGITSFVGGGDVTGDGNADLIATHRDGRLLLYPGNGAGGFLAGRQIGTGWSSYRLVP